MTCTFGGAVSEGRVYIYIGRSCDHVRALHACVCVCVTFLPFAAAATAAASASLAASCSASCNRSPNIDKTQKSAQHST